MIAVARSAAGASVPGAARGVACDLRDPAATRAAMAEAQPDLVVHLAAQANVSRSWRDPAATLHDNVAHTLSVLEAVRAEAPAAALVLASSGEVYGVPERLPVTEEALLRPQNPYAVSKAATDLLGGLYADAHGLRVVRARAFNHAGPGQEPLYAIASFARQVAAGLETGADPVRVVTGSPDTRRDYTDVRDVVRAYRLLGDLGEPGVWNVCAGDTRSARELVAALGAVCGVRVEHVVDPALVRAHEVAEVRGSSERLRAATGWAPAIPLETTLADAVAHWRAEIRAGRADPRMHE